MKTIKNNSKPADRHPAGMKTTVLITFMLVAPAVARLNAQEPLELTVTNHAVLLEWPVPAEECIVVGTTSLTNSVWTPWPQPIFKRFGKLCMAVPATNCLECFKLVSGTQFIDDFSPAPQWPFATKGNWMPYFYSPADPSRFEVTNVSSALRIRTVRPAEDGRVPILPPGPDVVVRDFCASVDITDWPVQGVQGTGFGIVARGWRDPDNPFPGNSNGYIGAVRREASGTARLVLGNNTVSFTYDPAADYRLVFSAVGTDLSLRVWNLTTETMVCEMPHVSDSQWSQGFVCFWVNAGADGSCDLTLDNFFVTGTKP